MTEVEAVQWTAHNLDEVRVLCPEAHTVDSGWTLVLPISKERQTAGIDHLVAHVGYYVVLTPSGLCLPMTATAFEGAYEVLS